MVAERLNYLSLLFIENYIPKSLSDEEAIKQHTAIKCKKKLLQKCVRQLINTIVVIFLNFVILVVFVSFSKICSFFVISILLQNKYPLCT